MNRNRPEVSTRWSTAGAASVYNLRLPPKASGNATGPGPAPGFMRLTPDSRAPARPEPVVRVASPSWVLWLLPPSVSPPMLLRRVLLL